MVQISNRSLPTHDGNVFHWSGNRGVVDASDLSCGGTRPIDGRVWNDACDVGFRVKSQRTGNEVLFVQDCVKCDAEGEVTATEYVSQSSPVVKIIVIND